MHQLCEDTGCSPKNLSGAMNDWEEWRERVRDIRAGDTTWWWWRVFRTHIHTCTLIHTRAYIYIYICWCICVCTCSYVSLSRDLRISLPMCVCVCTFRHVYIHQFCLILTHEEPALIRLPLLRMTHFTIL